MSNDSAAVGVYSKYMPPEILEKYRARGFLRKESLAAHIANAAADFAEGNHYDTRIDASDLKAIVTAGKDPLRRFRAARTRELKRRKAHAQKPHPHNRNWHLK